MAQALLWNDDQQLVVLYKLLERTEQIYNTLREQGNDASELTIKRHKFGVEWVLDEILRACRNHTNWYRGRQQLGRLVDLRMDLNDYYEKVLNQPEGQRARLFRDHHHEFYATHVQIKGLFAN